MTIDRKNSAVGLQGDSQLTASENDQSVSLSASNIKKNCSSWVHGDFNGRLQMRACMLAGNVCGLCRLKQQF